MSREILQNIINDFETERFVRFFREKNRSFAPKIENLIQYEDNDFKNGLKLGEIKFNSGEQMFVCAFRANQPLSERSGKKSQYEKAKTILKETQSDAGIFIFYDRQNNFRFSLIYANYLGTRRDWSNFRRFTYFVSKEFTNKTFLQRIGEGDFSSLDKIKDAFSVEKVTKSFYTDIAHWYFWAVRNSCFPKDAESEENGRNIAIIRMITRLIFIWFMREKGLIKKDLFNYQNISELLKDLSPEKTTYYKAILQNLFFSTLNTRIKDRKFRFKITGWKNSNYMDHNVYRYEDHFKNQEDMLEIFKDIPFLNGGLFDCLDRKIEEASRNIEIRIDGFSDKEKGQNVPNFLFFSGEKDVDLNKEYGTKSKKYKVRGLIDTLSSYNFTIDENEPNDQEVALDPELLGKVFENLLASFNPETASTARKATGSYYTPREIVDYMVAQSLKEYFKTHLKNIEKLDEKLNTIFSPNTEENPFSEPDTKRMVKLVDDLRIVDPAVGSGAFPMGILNRLVFILSKLDPDNKLWEKAQMNAVEAGITDPALKNKLKDEIAGHFAGKNPDYGRKLHLIQKCIYGVDIQQIAVEIAKLRFFISLLVDEKIDKNKENWGIEPLPNLDFKIMQGNSLLEEYEGVKLFNEKLIAAPELNNNEQIEKIKEKLIELQREYLQLYSAGKLTDLRKQELEMEVKNQNALLKTFTNPKKPEEAGLFDMFSEAKKKADKLKRLHKEFFEASQKAEKDELKKDIETLQWELIEATLKEQNKESSLKKLEQYKKSNSRPFFLWKLYFSEVFQEKGGFDIVIANPPYVKEDVNRHAFDGLRNSECYQGKMDLWYLFGSRGLDILKNNGVMCFIATNNWISNDGASTFRNKVIAQGRIVNFVDFGGCKIFSAGIQTMVFILLRNEQPAKYCLNYGRLVDEQAPVEVLEDFLKKQGEFINEHYTKFSVLFDRSEYVGKYINFIPAPVGKILDKIKSKTDLYLGDDEIFSGVDVMQDFVTKRHLEKLNNSFSAGDGVFVLSNSEKKAVKWNEKELRLLKPYYTTKEIHRYYANTKNKFWILYTSGEVNAKITECPNIKRHLDRFQSIITSVNKPYGLHRTREEDIFLGEKILATRKCARPSFSFVDFPSYVSRTFLIIKTERLRLKYLLSILNSKLIAFWLFYKGKLQGNQCQIDKVPLRIIPILNATEDEQAVLIQLVDRILTMTKDDDYLQNPAKQAKVKEYERQIDQMVYKLYALTDKEIDIIEGNKKIME